VTEAGDAQLPKRWRELSEDLRAALAGKLDGLYGATGDEQAFDALEVNKQQALLLFVGRLGNLHLWREVERVENVYGRGGVGMNFAASALLEPSLRSRTDFTSRWASHQDATGGFRERRRRSAALHFLYAGEGRARRWSVHFDLYNPLASPLGAWQHLLQETLRGVTPDWQMIRAELHTAGDLESDERSVSNPYV
jgi:hypothetical protein